VTDERQPVPDWADMIAERDAEITRLKAEVARLRGALEEIAGYRMKGRSSEDIARAALTRIALEEAAKVAIDVFDGKDEICSAEIAAAIRGMTT